MTKITLKRVGKITVKSLFLLMILGAVGLPFMGGGLKDPRNPLSHKKTSDFDSLLTKTFTIESVPEDQVFSADDLMPNIQNFVKTPEGGIAWDILAQTKQIPYFYKDEEGDEWGGVRPEFSEDLKALDGKEILIQGYMFPLSQEEGQEMFLLGPFPISCPFHYHVTPNLIIEVHAKTPETFIYEAVNVSGQLDLVPKDDEYNVFYRLKGAEIVAQN